MKKPHLRCLILTGLLAVGCTDALSQGGPFAGLGRGPRFDGHLAKVFGEHKAFTSALDIQASSSDRPDAVTMSGKLSYSDGKSRLEMDMTKIKGSMMDPAMIEQLKALGMGEMIVISRPDNGSSFLVYPGLQSFAKISDNGTQTASDKFTIDSKELGKESVNGQDCVKNKVTVTSPDGKTFEATVWNATAMKKFPVRVQSSEGGTPFTLTFKDVKFDKPASSLFETPASYAKYDDVQSLMRGALMKKLGEGNGLPSK